ncbi:hypothetical protein CR513_25249, partial [Mucuna pruriens]
MPSGWNANIGEQPTTKGHEQAGMNNLGTGPTQGSGTRPPSVYGAGPYWAIRSCLGAPKASSGNGKLSMLEERLQIIEGSNSHKLDATNLYLVLNVVLPTDFKMLKFEKYKGRFCPCVHLAMYCRKMASYIHQDKIFDNLTRAALNWYVNLEKGHVKTW